MKLHILLLVAAGCALCACSGPKAAVSVGGQPAPGESAQVSQAPLSVPPNFAMAATAANASQPLGGTNSGSTPDGTQSSGEQALLQTAGAASPDPDIRQTIDKEAANDAGTSQALMDKLTFWQNSSLQPTGTAPTIKRKTNASMLDSIF